MGKFLVALLFVSTVLAQSHLLDALKELAAESKVGGRCPPGRAPTGWMGMCQPIKKAEEELAFNRGRTAEDCLPDCLKFDKWRSEEGVHPDDSCENQCKLAWPERSTEAGSCVPGEYAGIFKSFWEKKCPKKDKNACIKKAQ